MALTEVNYFITSGIVAGGPYDGLRELFWFLNGTHPTASPQNTTIWACIDCYDGTTREQPTSGDMTNLSSGQLWKPSASPSGALPQGSYATFESPGNGSVVAKVQCFVKMEAFSAVSVNIISLADWTIGGGTDASPTLPATILSQPPGTGGIDGRFANSTLNFFDITLDEDMFLIHTFRATGSTGAEWMYFGGVVSWNTEADDPRPFIFPRNVNSNNWQETANWRRISPNDSSTICTCNDEVFANATMDPATQYDNLTSGNLYLCPVGVFSNTASHLFRIGTFRNVGACDEGIPVNRATVGITGSDFRFTAWADGLSQPVVVVKYPPGTSLPGGHTVVAEATIPAEMLPPAGGGGGDTTAPVVTFVNPIPGAQIRSSTAITIDVTDDSGTFAGVQLRVEYRSSSPQLPTETIHGGDVLGTFEPFYTQCTVSTITDGFRFVLTRVNPDSTATNTGWPSTPTFVASPVDSSGNVV